MGNPTGALVNQDPAKGDQANAVVEGAFTEADQVSGNFLCWGAFNLVLYGDSGPNGSWDATINLERSFDAGTTWITCGIGGAGQQASWATGTDVSIVAGEPEKGVVYRLRCAAYTSGTINYRLSTTGQAALSFAVNTN